MLVRLLLAVLLIGCACAQAQELPDGPEQTFNKKLFVTEAVTNGLLNLGDGIITVHNIHTGGFEHPCSSNGSACFLGKRPSALRYAAVMGGIEVAETLAAYKLEHSNNRVLRFAGHGLMVSGMYAHADGLFISILDRNAGAAKKANAPSAVSSSPSPYNPPLVGAPNPTVGGNHGL